MRVLFLDLVGGAAGDMIMAALVDAGAPLDTVRAAVARLVDVEIQEAEAHPAGLRAKRIDVMIGGVLADTDREGEPFHVHDHDHHHHDHHHEHHDGQPHDHPHHRPYRVVRGMIEEAELPQRARALALDAFRRLAEAEAKSHGVAVEEVLFHEVGADDAIADIVGCAVAFDVLGVDEVVVSPVPMGRGLIRGAHGPIPLPGPAALHILVGAPLEETSLQGETVTPTGAALVAALADRFGPMPSMKLEAVGVGAGHKSWPDRPNVVRALIGEGAPAGAWNTSEDCVVEANIDDMNPEHYGALERALFAAGALDVWVEPIHMKKGRLGTRVSALVRRSQKSAMADTFFEHSTTLGVRVVPIERLRAERRVQPVETPYGTVRVKVVTRASGPLFSPEHEDCERLAEAKGVPIRLVYEAALRAAWT